MQKKTKNKNKNTKMNKKTVGLYEMIAQEIIASLPSKDVYLQATFYEIYNETVFDLFRNRSPCTIRESEEKNMVTL